MKTLFKNETKINLLLSRFTILILVMITLSACSGNERIVKKLFKRLDAREVNKASKYVYPEDQVYLYVFNNQFLKNDKAMNFEINQMAHGIKDNEPFVFIKLKCNNCSDNLKKYFNQRGLIIDGLIVDTIWIKKVNESKFLTFPWKWDTKQISKDLKLAKVTSEILNIRSGPGQNYSISGILKEYDKVLIDRSTEKNNWLKCFTFDEKGNVNLGYIASNLTQIEDISFFNIGLFGKLGLLVASIIALVVIILIIPLMLTTIFRSAEDNWTLGLILFGVLIGILFLTYQIIENVLFELFLINLPF